MVQLILVLALLVFTSDFAHATQYYAEAAGSDSNTCLTGSRCATLAKLMSLALVPGDILSLKVGEYFVVTSQIDSAVSGTASSPITLTNHGTKVDLTGTHSGSSNNAALVDSTHNFGTDGVTAGMRLHNLDNGSMCAVGSVSTTSSTNDTVNCATPLAMGNERDFDLGDRYRIENLPVITEGSLVGTWTVHSGNIWKATLTSDPKRMVLQNGTIEASWADVVIGSSCPTALVADHQYCWTGNVLYLYSTSDPDTRYIYPGIQTVANSPTIGTMLSIANNYWVVDGVVTSITNSYALGSAGNFTLKNSILSFARWKDAVSSGGNGGRPVYIVGASAGQTVSNVLVQDTAFINCGRDCVDVSGAGTLTGITFRNVETYNVFNHIPFMLGHDAGAGTGPRSNITLEGVTCHGTASCISTGPATPTFTNGVFDRIKTFDLVLKSDARVPIGATIGLDFNFAVTLEGAGATVTLKNSDLTGGSYGVDINANAFTLTMTNNTVWGMTRGCAIVIKNPTSSGTATFNRNICYNNGNDTTLGSTDAEVGSAGNTTSNVIWAGDYNVYYHFGGSNFAWTLDDGSMGMTAWRVRSTGDDNAELTDPLFISATNHNLQSGSPARDQVAVAPYIGSGRDAGAYESPTFSSGQAGVSPADADTWCVDFNTLWGLSCTASGIHPKVNADSGRTASVLTYPASNRVCFNVSGTTPVAGNTLTVDFDAAACNDAMKIGNLAAYSADMLAASGQSIVNNIGGAPTHVRTQTHVGAEAVGRSEYFEPKSAHDGTTYISNALHVGVILLGEIRGRFQVENETATAPTVGYSLECVDDAGFGAGNYDVTNTSTGRVSFTTDAGLAALTPLTTSRLPLAGDTFLTTGTFMKRDTLTSAPVASLVTGRRFELLAALKVTSGSVGQYSLCRVKGLEGWTNWLRLNLVAGHGEH